jgi:hypothetical protein
MVAAMAAVMATVMAATAAAVAAAGNTASNIQDSNSDCGTCIDSGSGSDPYAAAAAATDGYREMHTPCCHCSS